MIDLSSLLKAEIARKQQDIQKTLDGDSVGPEKMLEKVPKNFGKESEEKDSSLANDLKVSRHTEVESEKPFSHKTGTSFDISEQEKLQTRHERISFIRQAEQNLDTKISVESIGVKDQQQHISIQCNLYIHFLLRQWQENGYKPDLLLETRKSLYPLLVKLRKRQLPSEFLTSISTIIYYIQQDQFSLAIQSYMKLSIGNVAWPIGVTSIGIHARSAHERIQGNDKIANVMLDETTRLWITSVKRLISFTQALSRKKSQRQDE
ncbi:LADA_0C04588g1_1 [Lachancea dasiensis]|uniref:Pre-mRNA-splicing factor 18 n=1 Tax=Lachancea dasiensis TaxID=1072105 RepID=A0A1G4IZB7_9SACH|nr:LADA_0C04588g1_1 [Lachancea dasiensis]